MVNTFSDSPHKAAVFKSADKVHSNVLEVLQCATHTTQCLSGRGPEMNGLNVCRGRIHGLSSENGVELACPGSRDPGALRFTVPTTGWEASGTAGRDQAALSILHHCLVCMGHNDPCEVCLQPVTAAPLFKRGVHKFWVWCCSPSCTLLFHFSCSFTITLHATEFLSGSPFYSALSLCTHEPWMGCCCSQRRCFLSPGSQRSIHSSHHIRRLFRPLI